MKEGNRSHFMKINDDSWSYYRTIAEEQGLTTLELLRRIVAAGEKVLAIEREGKGEAIWKFCGREIPLKVIGNTNKKIDIHFGEQEEGGKLPSEEL